jgi:hypothetical protein
VKSALGASIAYYTARETRRFRMTIAVIHRWSAKVRRIALSATFWAALAAFGSVWAANEARKAAEISRKSVEIETSPVLLLDCRPDFVKYGSSSTQPIKILDLFPTVLNGIMETNSVDALSDRSSQIYACSVTNYGRLPVLNLQLRFRIYFLEEQKWPSPIRASHDHAVAIPGLAPSSSYDFLVVNDSKLAVKVVPSTSINIEMPGRAGAFQSQLHLGYSASDMFVPYFPVKKSN